MNSKNRQSGNDSTLDRELDELGREYRELEAETPPDLLDQAILNSAHRAVGKKPGWMQFGWLHGLTTAAVIVLAFSIVLHQREPLQSEEGIIIESSPPLMPSESSHDDWMQKMAPAAAIEQESEEAAKSNHATPQYDEPRKEQPLLENMAGAPAAARELAVPVEEGKAAATQGKAPGVSVADIAATTVPVASHDEDSQQDTVPPERQLAEILRLKHAGDDSWHQALASFRQHFPDYPLPAELED